MTTKLSITNNKHEHLCHYTDHVVCIIIRVLAHNLMH